MLVGCVVAAISGSGVVWWCREWPIPVPLWCASPNPCENVCLAAVGCLTESVVISFSGCRVFQEAGCPGGDISLVFPVARGLLGKRTFKKG